MPTYHPVSPNHLMVFFIFVAKITRMTISTTWESVNGKKKNCMEVKYRNFPVRKKKFNFTVKIKNYIISLQYYKCSCEVTMLAFNIVAH
jgi:hypothetical protein